jgi:NAD(P)H-hydrate epimerase
MSLPRWMEPLLDAELMRETDRWAIDEKKIPSLELMERAGEGLARVTAEVAPAGRIAIVCGKGNNGGDGLVAARHLREAGRDVEVLLLWPPQWLTEDAREMCKRLTGDAPIAYEAERLDKAHVIVDALLGTGFTGAPRDPIKGVIEAVNAHSRARVIAADTPSGVNGSTGEVQGEAIRATATATFHRAKPGLWIHPGKAHAGDVHLIDIGIPRSGAPGDPATGLIGDGVLRGYPRRSSDSSKFESGVVFVIGGSAGLTGAPSLTAAGAIRAGAGYVTLGAPRSLELAISTRAPVETMITALPEDDGGLSAEALEPALKAMSRCHAAVLGPGLGQRQGTKNLVLNMVERIDVPLVLDADGLNALEGVFPEDLPGRRWPTVLTPHEGELGRLLGVPSKTVKASRLEHARKAAAEAKAYVVLKGDDTLVVAPNGRAAISRGNAPALATAGTGDVLSGVIAAMLARGLPPAQAACAGVWVHCRAGRLAGERVGIDGAIASDVVASLPAALNE